MKASLGRGRWMWPALLVSALINPAGAAGLEGPQVFAIAPEGSHVVINVGKTGLLSFAGHTHEVIAPAVRGEVSFDPDEPARSTVRVEFDAAALKVTGRGEPAEDVPEVQQTMLSDRVLDVRRFPTILFQSRTVSLTGKTADGLVLTIAGDLTLHGVTRPTTVVVRASLGQDTITARGSFTIKQTDFGIEPVTAGLGLVRVKDALDVSFTLNVRR
ncbi:MAG: YceI family protein [Candidatus Tectomicrobia bacterium]|uniref:YceI family protein n=1 Tax=Tectimicrobiota bacterium TaxID=2528274 RepID=A0A932GQU3_UNCTE|nr:YceI family protein [Candidatus Tectomicrobia bacterium]